MENGTNLLGALALAIADAQSGAVENASGLSANGPAAIASIGIDPGITIGELAAVVGVTHSVAVRLVDGLVRKELVLRSFGTDKREVKLSLSRSGMQLRKRILSARLSGLNEVLSCLNKKDRQEFARLTALLLAQLTKSREHADHICRICDEGACGKDTCPVECRARELGPMS